MTSTQYYPPNFPPGYLAVPATEWMWTRCTNALIGLIGWLPPGSGVEINQLSSSVVDNRNGLIDRFLPRSSLEWILFFDSDMVPDPETACRLLSLNVDIVGALYYSRDGRYAPMYGDLQGERVETAAGGLRKVDWVGTGCMLIRRRVLEAMQPPYMEFLAPGIAEDVYFCRKARQLGFRVYVDTAHCVGHMSAAPIDHEAAKLYSQLPRVQEMQRNIPVRGGEIATTNAPKPNLEERLARYDENGIRVDPPAPR